MDRWLNKSPKHAFEKFSKPSNSFTEEMLLISTSNHKISCSSPITLTVSTRKNIKKIFSFIQALLRVVRSARHRCDHKHSTNASSYFSPSYRWTQTMWFWFLESDRVEDGCVRDSGNARLRVARDRTLWAFVTQVRHLVDWRAHLRALIGLFALRQWR